MQLHGRHVFLAGALDVSKAASRAGRRAECSTEQHSIVIITSLVVAGTASAISHEFSSFSRVGGIIGTSVSASVLLLLGLVNAHILWRLTVQMRRLLAVEAGTTAADAPLESAGCLFSVLHKLLRLVDRPWKMYPLGVLFGLGFDTSSEVALLGMSSIEAARGTSIWLILVYPVLFTAGMCLLDTADGALMMALYASTRLARDAISTCYHSMVLTAITVLVAAAIGLVQVLNLVLVLAEPRGGFWDGVQRLGEHWDVVGMSAVAVFVCGLRHGAYRTLQAAPSVGASSLLARSGCFCISRGEGALMDNASDDVCVHVFLGTRMQGLETETERSKALVSLWKHALLASDAPRCDREGSRVVSNRCGASPHGSSHGVWKDGLERAGRWDGAHD